MQQEKTWIDKTFSRAINSDGTYGSLLETDFGYDDIGRQTSVDKDHLIGVDSQTFTYNDAGVITNETLSHIGNETMNFEYDYVLDDVLRVRENYMILNGDITGKFLLNQFDYDSEDRVVTKYLDSRDDGTTFLQAIGYSYDGAGKLLGINGFDEINGSDDCSNVLRCLPNACNIAILAEVERDGSRSTKIEQVEATTDGRNTFPVPLNYPYDLRVVYDSYDTRGAPEGKGRIDDDGLIADLETWYQQNDYFYDEIRLEFEENQGPSFAKITVVDSEINLSSLDDNITISVGDCCESEVISISNTNMDGQTVHYSPDLFGMELNYSGLDIRDVYWQTACGHKQQYEITYDALHRLKAAKHFTYDPAEMSPIEGRYSMNVTSYDAVGNIKGLFRNGMIGIDAQTGAYQYGLIDHLKYEYSNDRLQSVEDKVTDITAQLKGFVPTQSEYTYDNNGNMTSDSGKGLTIPDYSYLNLPMKMIIAGNEITFTYAADGTKLKKVVTGSEGYEQVYAGTGDYRDTELESVRFGEGRVTLQLDEDTGAKVPRIEYILRDHLGNTRIMFSDLNQDQQVDALEILQENHYYPFGLNMEGEWCEPTNGTEHLYQYNDKELNTDYGLGLNDYGARWYDASIGRFSSIDRFAEDYYPMSNFGYAANAPMKFIDVNGDYIVLYGEGDLSGNREWEFEEYTYEYGKEYKGNNPYIAEAVETLNYLIANNLSVNIDGVDILEVVANSKEEIKLYAAEPDNLFAMDQFDEGYLAWNSRLAFTYYTNYWGSTFLAGEEIITPAIVLLHELGHAYTWVTDKEKYYAEFSGWEIIQTDRWTDPDEKHVIKTLENVALEKLGKKPRASHNGGEHFIVECPTCEE